MHLGSYLTSFLANISTRTQLLGELWRLRALSCRMLIVKPGCKVELWEAFSNLDKFKMGNILLALSSMDSHQLRTLRECFKINQALMEVRKLFIQLNTNYCCKIWNKTISQGQLTATKCNLSKIRFSRITCFQIRSWTTLWDQVEVLLDIIKPRKTCGESQIYQKSKGMGLPVQSWSEILLPQTCTI